MHILLSYPRPEELSEVIIQFKPDEVTIINTNRNYTELVKENQNIKFNILDYFKFFSTAFTWEEIKKLPGIDSEDLRDYQDLELECLFNDERIGKNTGLSWNNTAIYVDPDLVYDSTNKYAYQNERKTTLERFRDFRYQLAYWIDFFQTHQVDIIINMVAPHMPFQRILQKVARNNKINLYYTQNTAFTDHHFIVDNHIEHFYADLKTRYEAFAAKHNRKTFEFIEDQTFLNEYKRITNREIKDFSPIAESMLIKKRKINNSFTNRLKHKLRLRQNLSQYIGIFSLQKVLYNLQNEKQRRAKHRIIKQLQQNTFDFKQNPYFFFPLHFQPEETSCPRGGRYADQLLIVKLLSETLPAGYSLVVKDHPQQKEIYRPIWFFKEITCYNNVQLIPSEENSKTLIESAVAIVTISGTAAWEGFGKGKPAIFFGTHPAMIYKQAYHVKNKQQLQKACNQIIKSASIAPISQDPDMDLKIFFDFFLKNTVKINFYRALPYGTISAKDSARNYIAAIKDMYQIQDDSNCDKRHSYTDPVF